MPLEGHALGHVNAYALRDAHGFVLIDSGWSSPKARDALTDLMHEIGASLDDVHTLLLTHVHGDHAGLAGYIQERSGARVLMHAADAKQIEPRHRSPRAYTDETCQWLAASGVPGELWDFVMQQVRTEQARFLDLTPDEIVGDAERSSESKHGLVAVHTPGHTAGHLCFHDDDRRLLFSGDTVFRRINYGPTFRPFACPDPLGEYLESLDRLERLKVDLVLPGHGRPFGEFHARLHELRAHHEGRAEEILRLVKDGEATVWEVAARLTRSQRWAHLSAGRKMSALGDAYAHLIRLSREGLVHSRGGPPIRWRQGDA